LKWHKHLGKLVVSFSVAVGFLSFCEFERPHILIDTCAQDTPLGARIDAFCARYLHGGAGHAFDYPFLSQVFFAIILSVFMRLLPGKCNNVVEFVLIVLLDPGCVGPILSSPSLAFHFFLIIATFSLLHRLHVTTPLARHWLLSFARTTVSVALSLCLRAESAIFILLVAVALWHLREMPIRIPFVTAWLSSP
jgi:hypothetical protein